MLNILASFLTTVYIKMILYVPIILSYVSALFFFIRDLFCFFIYIIYKKMYIPVDIMYVSLHNHMIFFSSPGQSFLYHLVSVSPLSYDISPAIGYC